MTLYEEMQAEARAEIAWHQEGRASRAAALRRTRAHLRSVEADVRARNALARLLAGGERSAQLRCATPAARRRTAATLRANAQRADERTDWDALGCGEQDHRIEQIQYALALASELERTTP